MANNILLITIDSLRADQVGRVVDGASLTPCLDNWSERCLVYRRAYAPSSWTMPSVVSMLNAVDPLSYGDYLRFEPRAGCLPVLLSRAGFYTILIHSNPFFVTSGLTACFARVIDPLLRVDAAEFTSRLKKVFWQWGDRLDLQLLRMPWLRRCLRRLYYLLPLAEAPYAQAPSMTAAAVAAIEAAEEPFFLWVHYMDPHFPYLPPRSSARELMLNEYSKYPEQISAAELASLKRLYQGEIVKTDLAVGALLEFVKRRGLLANTTVVVSADHGEEFLEHGGLVHAETLYNELLRVPLLIYDPERVSPGERDELVGLIDLAPTLSRAAGVPAPSTYSGRDLLAGGRAFVSRKYLFAGVAAGKRRVDYRRTSRAVIGKREKYILDNIRQTEELYDLEADPGEQNNLINRDKKTARRLRRLLKLHTGESAAA